MAKRVRLIDIADRLNLTKVSVSKALRDHPDISAETRELVKQTAAEMGYTPNLVARSLSSKRSHTLGVVVPKIAHTFFSSVIEAVQEEATQRGYGIVLAVSNETAALEQQHIERLLAMHVDGLLVSVSKEAPVIEIYKRVRDLGVPLVFFDRQVKGLGFSSVTVDDRVGAERGVRHLIEQGHTKIAYIGGTNEVEIGRERLAGYEAAMQAHGLPIRDEWVIEGGFDEGHGYRAFLEILETDSLPEAIFAATFPTGLGLWGAIRDHRPDLAGQIQIGTFGQGDASEFYTYPHVCVRQATGVMGRKALDLVLREIEGGEGQEPQHVVLETELVLPEAHAASHT